MNNKLYHQGSYLPEVPLHKKTLLIIFRFFLVAMLVMLLALLQSCSKKTLPEPSKKSPDLGNAAIKQFSLPGSIQVGETVFNIDENGYSVTINVKPGADVTSMRPYIELLAGSFISPSVGQIVNLNGDLVYKVTAPGGEVQNWRVHIVREEPKYLSKIFKENEKIIFVGNSITHGGRYHAYIWLYYITRFPNHRINIINGGIGGDKINNINNRLQADIFSKNPDRINLTFGMNDSGYFDYLFKDPVVVSNRLVFQADSAFKLVVNRLKENPQYKVTIMSGSPYDASAGGWSEKPATFERIIDLQKAAATQNNWEYVEVYSHMDYLNKFYQKYDPKFTLSGIRDHIHPESYGHLIMAYIYLRQQELKGLEVADFTVDANMKRVTHASRCEVRDVVASGDNLTFHYRADALPFPVDDVKHGGDDKSAMAALSYVPFTEDMNREMLRVTNLKGSNYDIKIDGKVIGRFGSDSIAAGINMALIRHTPQYLHALEIMKKNEERFLAEKLIRDYYVQVYNFARPEGITNDDDPASVTKMQELAKTNGWIDVNLYRTGSNPATRQQWQDKVDRLVNEIYASNKPLTRKIELVRVN